MSLSSWKNDLTIALASNPPPKVVFLGIGNAMNGDDAAGVWVARHLKRAIEKGLGTSSPLLCNNWLVIDAGVGPEAYTGVLRRFQPQLVLMIDAAQMGEQPGGIRVVECAAASGFGASTHTQSPSTLAEFLSVELGCRVLLVGIQPQQVDFDLPMSKAVRAAVVRLAKFLSRLSNL